MSQKIKDAHDTKTDTLRLECTLTDKERLAYSKLLAEEISAKKRAEDELERFRKQQNATISGNDAQINLLSEKLNTGREFRDVECTIELNFATNTATITRNDTGELVKERPLKESERQESLEV